MAGSREVDQFPPIEGAPPPPSRRRSSTTDKTQPPRRPSTASVISNRIRSLSKDFEESHPPAGFMAATGDFASSIINLSDESTTRPSRASSNTAPPSPIVERRASASVQSGQLLSSTPKIAEENHDDGIEKDISTSAEQREGRAPGSSSDGVTIDAGRAATTDSAPELKATQSFDNGYHFPPSYSKRQSTKKAAIAFWNYTLTPLGFCVVVYGLNVVAWGGMLFLLLCNASPAMCHPSCNNINSPRRKWIEWDSQILNALFCVTGFGLAPWRFRDFYYLMRYRIWGKQEALRRLAGIHRGWFRLGGSETLPLDVGPDNIQNREGDAHVPMASVPFPEKLIPNAPLTGTRAPPTALWRMDFVVWMMVGNTFLQCVLSGFMWGMNRYDRPSWSTGLFVALACIVAALGGLMMFIEGKKVKGIEGVPLSDEDREKLARDKELGIQHYNNLKDKPPKQEKEKNKVDSEKKHGLFARKEKN